MKQNKGTKSQVQTQQEQPREHYTYKQNHKKHRIETPTE